MEVFVVVFLVVVVGIFVKSFAGGYRRPALGDEFVCRGCGGTFNHTKRTVSAASRGLRSYFCGKCHHDWHLQQAQRKGANPAGCMVTLVCLSALPTAIVTYLLMS